MANDWPSRLLAPAGRDPAVAVVGAAASRVAAVAAVARAGVVAAAGGAAAAAIAAAAATALRFDMVEAIAVCLLLIALLVCTATDLLRYRVPNAVTYPRILLALLAPLLMPRGDFSAALTAALLSAAIFISAWAVTGGGIGFADVKLAIFIGAALGLPAAYFALAVGVFVAGVVMAALLAIQAVGRRQVTPYAPFLAVSAIAVVFVEGAAFAQV